ncbi:MAG: murein biosynthesis integral membrane protein MurJ [Acidobacteria bacterium]|nr:murein biosynthesis integral membrane protein MurJ [Acidobacteriota bacterium]
MSPEQPPEEPAISGPAAPAPPREVGRSRAAVVAAGIFSSRLVGFIRERAIAHFFGIGPYTDVLSTAFRGPNVLQVLFGEQTLSAAFIPTYARLIEEGREEDAGRFAGAIFGLLVAAAAVFSFAGVLLAKPIVAFFATGYLGDAALVAAGEKSVDRFALSVRAVRWVFPMTGILMLSAWCLGVLNSHRRFFLPYFAPVLWNSAIIVALILGSRSDPGAWWGSGREEGLLMTVCVGALIGGLLQFLVQLPSTLRLLPSFRLSFSTRVPGVRRALASFGPVFAGRGVVQISLYFESLLASLAAVGAVSAVRWGSFLYALPVSLFGISVAAAELPELARAADRDPHQMVERARRSLRQMSFLVLPTAVGYVLFGFLVAGAIYRTGEFSRADNWLVYLVLCAYSLGLPAGTTSRLLQNLFYAVHDTRSPAKVAVLRVVVTVLIGATLMFQLDRLPLARWIATGPGEELFLGAVGLALGSAVGSWVELWRLRAALHRRLDEVPSLRPPLPLVGLSLLAALPAGLLWWWLPPWPILAVAALVLGLYAATYLGVSALLGLPELEAWRAQLRRRRRRS